MSNHPGQKQRCKGARGYIEFPSPFRISSVTDTEMSVILKEGKMKTLKKIGGWLRDLKEDMKEDSVSQMKGTDKLPCCSKPIEPMTRKRR